MPDTKQDKLQKLQQRYIEQLPEKMAELQTYWSEIQNNNSDNDSLETLQRGAHNLAGSAGTFGFRRLSETTRELENLLNQHDDVVAQSEEFCNAIDAVFNKIQSHIDDGPDLRKSESSLMSALRTVDTTIDEERLVYVIEDEPLLAEEMTIHLNHFGYKVKSFLDLKDVSSSLMERLPSAMLIDVQLPEGDLAGIEFASVFNEFSFEDIPLIFISKREDWLARLAAARAGCDAYLPKPVDYSDLLERLDRLTHWQTDEPYKILIVDDMAVLAEHYSLVLQGAGMQTETVTDIILLFDTISEFQPDLILMDIFMPQCSGLDASRVLRQKSELLSVPIVFLSTETDPEKQLAAMALGGDDFLEKPINDNYLIASVTARAERFRKLRMLMHRDSLTGLFNHVTLKTHLEAELARILRHKADLVFSMIDIDNFKAINDTYGHPAGDRVIKNLSRLLMQRLRKTDIIGRYGGEEFGLILPDTKLADAMHIINDIRISFSEIVHQTEDDQFKCTFSAGLATAPPHTEINSLISTADDALYVSKNKGRNCINSKE